MLHARNLAGWGSGRLRLSSTGKIEFVSNHRRERDLHRAVAARVAHDLATRTTAQAVLLAGSVARGDHLPTSDVDLLVVDSESGIPMRQTVDSVLVECISHSEADWITRFNRPKTSWLYAFLDAIVLFEEHRIGTRLKEEAERSRQTYTASDELRQQLATMLWHGQAKIARAADEDEATQGFWAAVCVDTVLDGLYTIHDVPLPAGSRRLAYLDTVPLLADEQRLLQQYLIGSTTERFSALLQLTRHLREGLGPADHEPGR